MKLDKAIEELSDLRDEILEAGGREALDATEVEMQFDGYNYAISLVDLDEPDDAGVHVVRVYAE